MPTKKRKLSEPDPSEMLRHFHNGLLEAASIRQVDRISVLIRYLAADQNTQEVNMNAM